MRFFEQLQVDAEALVRGFGAGDGLEDQIDRRAGFDGAHCCRDVREHARLRGDRVFVDHILRIGAEFGLSAEVALPAIVALELVLVEEAAYVKESEGVCDVCGDEADMKGSIKVATSS